MLSPFDWLRRSRDSAELLATIRSIEAAPELFGSKEGLGPPHSALAGLCRRCWVYPSSQPADRPRYCPACQMILEKVYLLAEPARESILIWGYVNQLPRQLQPGQAFQDNGVAATYVHDERRFLVMLSRRSLKPWLQELSFYHGLSLKGLLQIFPTSASGSTTGDLLVRIVHQETRFPQDRLRVRFYAHPRQVFRPTRYERQGVLTFEVSSFLNMLEMAAVFRTILVPEERKILYRLLHTANSAEAQFYWGRFLGTLTQEARDMLNAWRIRQWPKPQVTLLYQLVEYVDFYQPD